MDSSVKEKTAIKVKPPVKWAGGKKQLLKQFAPLFPPNDAYNLYIEPFVGGGAVFFHLRPEKAVLIDSNEDLINFFRVVRDDVELLIEDLKGHKNEESYYYEIRAMDHKKMNKVSRASRFLFLNKTGYNGLWRVNKQGKNNVPFGRHKNPKIVDESNLRRVSEALKHVIIVCDDFSRVLDYTAPGSFIYFDPPYYPLSGTSYFTSYTCNSFNKENQQRLAGLFRSLDKKGCLLMLSNSDVPFIRELYSEYDIRVVYGRRVINSNSGKRGAVSELVIRNFS